MAIVNDSSVARIPAEDLIDHALAGVEVDPRVQRALADLRQVILARFPDATFEVERWTDPAGIYLRATIDAEDENAVMDACIDCLLKIQVERRLPVYVTPVLRR